MKCSAMKRFSVLVLFLVLFLINSACDGAGSDNTTIEVEYTAEITKRGAEWSESDSLAASWTSSDGGQESTLSNYRMITKTAEVNTQEVDKDCIQAWGEDVISYVTDVYVQIGDRSSHDQGYSSASSGVVGSACLKVDN